jgi:hypothetical protein
LRQIQSVLTVPFLVSFGLGLLGLLAVLVSRKRGWAIGAGLIYVAATLIALSVTDLAPITVSVAALLLGLGGSMLARRPWAILVAGAGAAVLAYGSGLPLRPLFSLTLAVFAVAVGAAITSCERRWPHATGILLAISVMGVYVTIPSTDAALVLVAALPVLVVSNFLGVRLGSFGAYAAGAIVIWSAVNGGFSRTGSVVGALAGFGLILVEPFARFVGRSVPRVSPVAALSVRLLTVAQLLTVTITSRVAGFREKSEPALLLAIAAIVIGWLAISAPWRLDQVGEAGNLGQEGPASSKLTQG